MDESYKAPFYHEDLLTYKRKMDGLINQVIKKDEREGTDTYFLLNRILRAKRGDLIKKYGPEAATYALFHTLGGSTTNIGQQIKETDFPAEDSVATFIDELVRRYKKGENLEGPGLRIIK